jgi:hypothetical protein
MVTRIREKLGTAGFVIAVAALMAVLGGTAVAAAGLNSTQKKEVKKIATKLAKKYPGPQGPTGSTGPQGPKGDTGAQGKEGAPGKDGGNGEDGVCSVSNPECILPPGGTLTGDWIFNSKGFEAPLQISFPLRVVPAPTFNILDKESPTANCPGIGEAAPGNLCIYIENFVNGTLPTGNLQTTDPTSGYTKWIAQTDPSQETYGLGAWAVTAAE